jgi:hypothetical protein
MANTAEQLRAIALRLGGPLMYLAGRGGLAAWKNVYADLAAGFGAQRAIKPDWGPVEKDLLGVTDIEKLLAVERATVETGKR